jgi:riboflavin synthase
VFTGLIDDVGEIERASATPAGLELMVRCRYEDLAPGESIALNGACLTVRECGARWFTVAVVETSLERTNIGNWRAGTRVNLERALRLGDRLGGHMVQGHVDAVAVVRSSRIEGDARIVDVSLPSSLTDLVVLHGSITIDGVSLTVNALPAADVVQLSLIDYTLKATTLGALTAGDHVHVEADIVGKYVQRLLAPYGSGLMS